MCIRDRNKTPEETNIGALHLFYNSNLGGSRLIILRPISLNKTNTTHTHTDTQVFPLIPNQYNHFSGWEEVKKYTIYP